VNTVMKCRIRKKIYHKYPSECQGCTKALNVSLRYKNRKKLGDEGAKLIMSTDNKWLIISKFIRWRYVKKNTMLLMLVVLNFTYFETLLELPRTMFFLRTWQLLCLSINPAPFHSAWRFIPCSQRPTIWTLKIPRKY